MTLRVDIPKLYALANELAVLENDIYTLSSGVVSAVNNVLGRVDSSGYAPLKAACDRALHSAKQAKELTAGICGRLSEQASMLESAARAYRAKDELDSVNPM